MAAFWEDDPGRTTFDSVDESGAKDVSWPSSFHFEDNLPKQQEDVSHLERNADAVAPLGAHEIWETVGTKSKSKGKAKVGHGRPEAELDMMHSKIFTLSAGLLELGIRSNNAAAKEY